MDMQFAEFHVHGDGRLTLYPLKIDRVPRRWKPRSEARTDTESRIVPEDPLRIELIEPPIVLKR